MLLRSFPHSLESDGTFSLCAFRETSALISADTLGIIENVAVDCKIVRNVCLCFIREPATREILALAIDCSQKIFLAKF